MSINLSSGNSATGSASNGDIYELDIRVSALEDQMLTTYKTAAPIPATALANGNITNEEFSTLDGIKTINNSTIQKQIDDLNAALSATPGASSGQISQAEYLTLDGIRTDGNWTIQGQFDYIYELIAGIEALLGSGAITEAEFLTLNGIKLTTNNDNNLTIQKQLNDLASRCTALEGGGGGANSGNGNVPIGTILPYGRDISDVTGRSPPTGYLRCIGQKVEIATYQALYDVIGDTYLYGRESQTKVVETKKYFFIPDLSGLFIRGEGGHSLISGCTGAAPGVCQDDKTQKHYHSYNMPDDELVILSSVAGGSNRNVWEATYSTNNSFSTGQQHSAYYLDNTPIPGSTGVSDSNETRPKNISLCYIIKF